MSFDGSLPENLLQLNKKQLVELIVSLQKENHTLKNYQDYIETTETKLVNIERRLNIQEQYNRRESGEMSGIDPDIKQEGLVDNR